MGVGRAGDAAGAEAGVNRAGEVAVFHQAHRLAGKIRQPFALARGLHAAVVHTEDDRTLVHVERLLHVEVGVEAVLQGFFQRGDAAAGLDPQAAFDAFGLDNSELLPGTPVQFDSGLYTEPLFGRQEPQMVLGATGKTSLPSIHRA